MSNFRSSIIAIASLSVGVLCAATDVASAQQKPKKLTYDQAWAECSKDVKGNVSGDETVTSAGRYTRGAACMKKYGYRLKK